MYINHMSKIYNLVGPQGATLLAVQGRRRPTGHQLDRSGLNFLWWNLASVIFSTPSGGSKSSQHPICILRIWCISRNLIKTAWSSLSAVPCWTEYRFYSELAGTLKTLPIIQTWGKSSHTQKMYIKLQFLSSSISVCRQFWKYCKKQVQLFFCMFST